jgi:hypothetical protein
MLITTDSLSPLHDDLLSLIESSAHHSHSILSIVWGCNISISTLQLILDLDYGQIGIERNLLCSEQENDSPQAQCLTLSTITENFHRAIRYHLEFIKQACSAQAMIPESSPTMILVLLGRTSTGKYTESNKECKRREAEMPEEIEIPSDR